MNNWIEKNDSTAGRKRVLFAAIMVTYQSQLGVSLIPDSRILFLHKQWKSVNNVKEEGN